MVNIAANIHVILKFLTYLISYGLIPFNTMESKPPHLLPQLDHAADRFYMPQRFI